MLENICFSDWKAANNSQEECWEEIVCSNAAKVFVHMAEVWADLMELVVDGKNMSFNKDI